VVGIKHNNRKENCAGSEDVTRDRCAHLAPSVTSLARTSRLIRRRRYSPSTGVTCSSVLEVPPPRGFGDAAACPHKGPAVARPLDRGTATTTPDRGTSATARRGNGVAATGLGTAATVQGHCRRLPSGSGAAAAGLGTAATTCRGRGAAATAATGRASTAARAIGQPPSLMNRDVA
jgi:hypothetical protein